MFFYFYLSLDTLTLLAYTLFVSRGGNGPHTDYKRRIDQMRKITDYGFDVVGKKLSDTLDVDFNTCYPLVDFDSVGNKNAVIIGIVCAEFGDGIFDNFGRRVGTWETDGNVAWEAESE